MASTGIRNYYSVLGVAENASYDEIKSRYSELVKRWHPDACDDANAHEKFMKIAEAYEMLKSEETRNLFDQMLAEYRARQRAAQTRNDRTKSSSSKNTVRDSDGWEELIRRSKEANEQAEYWGNQSINDVLAYLKDRILHGQSALRGHLGFGRRSLLGFRALFWIACLVLGAVTVVGFPLAIRSGVALARCLTYKGYYIGVVTLLTSTLLALVEVLLFIFVMAQLGL